MTNTAENQILQTGLKTAKNIENGEKKYSCVITIRVNFAVFLVEKYKQTTLYKKLFILKNAITTIINAWNINHYGI